MENIVKILLEKGIDEVTIHEVLDVIEEAEIPGFMVKAQAEKEAKERAKKEAKVKKYERDSLSNLVQNVKGEKRTPGPIVK